MIYNTANFNVIGTPNYTHTPDFCDNFVTGETHISDEEKASAVPGSGLPEKESLWVSVQALHRCHNVAY